jgi:nickel transport protein
MSRTCLQAVLLAAGLSLPAVVLAHGTHGATEEGGGAVCASAAYDDGSPMSYAAVDIFSPADKKLPFQTGRTDRNGYFCFRPDAPGRWKLTAKDEEGHQVRLSTRVSPEMVSK